MQITISIEITADTTAMPFELTRVLRQTGKQIAQSCESGNKLDVGRIENAVGYTVGRWQYAQSWRG